MGTVLAAVVGAGGLAVAAGYLAGLRDRRAMRQAWRRIAEGIDPDPPRFVPSMLEGQPEIACRYFTSAIQAGTPLHRTAALEMSGTFTLNGKDLPLRAWQILAPPLRGFVWYAEIGNGGMRFSGSDGYLSTGDGAADSWTRFWLHGLFPLVRAGGNADHARAAATRLMLESVWAPASLLPKYGAVWLQTGPDSAEVRFPALPAAAPIHLVLDVQGAVVASHAMRWTDANPAKVFRLQPFGGTMIETGMVDGFRIPLRMEVGNMYGTPDYAPFFRVHVTRARFGPAAAQSVM